MGPRRRSRPSRCSLRRRDWRWVGLGDALGASPKATEWDVAMREAGESAKLPRSCTSIEPAARARAHPAASVRTMNMPASCVACGRVMERGSGCTVERIGEHTRVPYGSEENDWGAASGAPCHDCAVLPGQLHHWFCDVARCADCRGQEHEGPCDVYDAARNQAAE